jgi:hypothetical protein
MSVWQIAKDRETAPRADSMTVTGKFSSFSRKAQILLSAFIVIHKIDDK